MTTSSASKQDRPDPRCPKCGFTMCQLFDERPVTALCVEATPNGKYQCYHCTPLTAAQATPPASPEPPDRTREAFRAGFLAVCKRKGDTQLLDILTRVWSFDGVAAADLEPEAYEAWRAASPVPVAPASSRPQERE